MTRQAVERLRLIAAFPVLVSGIVYRSVAIEEEPLTRELVRECTVAALIVVAALFVVGGVVAAFNKHFPRRED